MAADLPVSILRRADLTAAGLSRRQIADAVRAGRILRARQGVYLPSTAPEAVVLACAVGGVLGCVDALSSWGVFARTTRIVHVRVPPHATRLTRHRPGDVTLHWRPTVGDSPPLATRCTVIDALVDAAFCESTFDFVASLDSALHLRLIDDAALGEVFTLLPERYAHLRRCVDDSAESGSETHMRLLLDALGVSYETQVLIAGVGRVDFVVEGWLIVECDSRAHHGGWDAQARDRRRDLAAARQGFATLRPTAIDVFETPELVSDAVRGLLATSGAVRTPVQSIRVTRSPGARRASRPIVRNVVRAGRARAVRRRRR